VQTNHARSEHLRRYVPDMAPAWSLSVHVRLSGTVMTALKTQPKENAPTRARTKVYVRRALENAYACQVGLV